MSEHIDNNVLLYLISAIIIFIIIAICLSGKKNKKIEGDMGVNKYNKASKGALKFSLGKLLEIRYLKGVEESLSYSCEFEKDTVSKIAQFEVILHQSDEYNELKSILNFIEKYQKEYCSSRVADKAMLESFIKEMKDIQQKEDIKIPPTYQLLLALSHNLAQKNLLLLIQILSNQEGKFKYDTIKDYNMKELTSCLDELTRKAKEYINNLTGDQRKKQEAVEYIKRAFEKAHNTCGKDGTLEIIFLKNILTDMIETARKTATEIADKPSFDIELEDVKDDKILLESEHLRLLFNVKNKNHEFIQVEKINIQPISKSMEIEYNGSSKDVCLVNGEKTIDFTFRTYILEEKNFEKRPTIEFKIRYWLMEEEFDQTRNFQLPEIVPRKRITNPFDTGRVGTGLPGDSPLFTGRQSLLSEICINLLNFDSPSNFYLIYGIPRTGKSSILNQLSGNPNWLKRKYVPIDVSAQESQNIQLFFKNLYLIVADKIKEMGVGVEKPEEKFFKDVKAPSWQLLIELLRLNEEFIIDKKKRLLFIIDEYQKIAMWDIPSGRENISQSLFFQIPEFIKILRDSYGDIASLILAGQESLERVARHNTNWITQLGGRIVEKKISNFFPEEADSLLRKNFEERNIEISQDCLDRIRLYTSGHPFLHVLMGYYIFNLLIDGDKIRINRKVQIDDIDNAALKIQSSEIKFIWADPWILNNPESRILVMAFAELSYLNVNSMPNMPSLTIQNIKDHLFRTHRTPYEQFNYDFAVTNLITYGIIERVNQEEGDGYRLLYPIFAIIAHNNNLLSSVLSEIRQGPKAMKVSFQFHR